MGTGKFDLWKDQGVDPRSMVYLKPNQIWGPAPAIRTIDIISKEAEILNNYRPIGFSEKYFKDHFIYHKKEFDFKTEEEYKNAAKELLSSALSDTIIGFVSNVKKDIYKYDISQNILGVGRRNGIIKTYFKPINGFDHWGKLKERNDRNEI